MTRRKAAQATRREPAKITQMHLDSAAVANDAAPAVEFKTYEPLPGVIPKDKEQATFAMDATPYEAINAMYAGAEYSGFRGYPALAAMSQQVEYSNMHNVFADEMTRNWIEVKSRKEGDHDPAIDEMERALEKFDVKRLMHEAVRQDSMFGVAHIFIDVGATGDELSKPLFLDPRKITRDSLKGLRVVNPTWVYPALYNTRWPLQEGFYKPQAWFVMGDTVHESRFMDIVSRPVPDILKPSYNFGGLSLTQLMEDYVNDWRDAKKNVIKILRTLRMRALQTDMDARLQEPGQFDKRIKLFTQYQDNFGIWAIDKEENLLHMQTSLSELSNLLSNYQDQLCMPARITNLKLLGNAPAGLNASGDSELATWHETVSGYQDGEMRRPLENIFKLIQLSEFGAINDDIYFEFKPLDEISEKERAEIAKLRVETVAVAADSQLVSSEEAREALKGIENAGFETLDGDYEPEEPREERKVMANDSAQSNGFASVRPVKEIANAIYQHLLTIGIKDAIKPEDMHVTLMYSKDKPIGSDADPDALYDARINGKVEIMGNAPWRALVLHVDSEDLQRRHDDLKMSGAIHSYPTYKAHMSVKYSPLDSDLVALQENPIKLDGLHLTGEKFKPIKE